MPESVTEWALRWPAGFVKPCANEQEARDALALMRDNPVLVRRTVTSTEWEEVAGDG
jgi:hypothetical protein